MYFTCSICGDIHRRFVRFERHKRVVDSKHVTYRDLNLNNLHFVFGSNIGHDDIERNRCCDGRRAEPNVRWLLGDLFSLLVIRSRSDIGDSGRFNACLDFERENHTTTAYLVTKVNLEAFNNAAPGRRNLHCRFITL